MSLIAIATSDWHSYEFKNFDVDGSRLKNTLAAGKEIMNAATKHDVPILFAGDLYHTPKELGNKVLTDTIDLFQMDLKTRMFAISGNHDQDQKNGFEYKANTYLKMHWATNKLFTLIDYQPGIPYRDDFLIQGVPYMNSEDEIKKAVDALRRKAEVSKLFKILLMHGDVAGCKDHNEHEMYDGKLFKNGVDNFFKPWDLVLYGHIHRPQQITKKVYMLGSPIHQISSDKGEMGYWQIYNDRDPKFVGLADYPKFIHLGKDETPPVGGKDYYIPFEKEAEIAELEKGDFNMNVSRTKMARRWMKAVGIKSKAKRKELIHILNSIE